MDMYEHRRLRLLELFDTKKYGGHGGLARLAKDTGIDASYISRLRYPEGKKGRKRLADETIQALQAGAGLAPGWFDMPLGTPATARTLVSIDRAPRLQAVENDYPPECMDLWKRYSAASPRARKIVDAALSHDKARDRRDPIGAMVDGMLAMSDDGTPSPDMEEPRKTATP